MRSIVAKGFISASTTFNHLSQRATFVSLPVVDVAALIQPGASQQQKQAVAEELHQACKDVGFFYVKNHGVPKKLCEEVLAQSRQWFNLPEAVKAQVLLSPATHYRGYQRLGANVTRFEGGYVRDWHEALDYFKEEDNDAVQARGHPPSPLHGPNPWPSQLPGYDATLKAYISAVKNLGSRLMRGIARGLGLPEEYFEGGRAGEEGSYWILRVIHYPPLVEASSSTNNDSTSSSSRSSSSISAQQQQQQQGRQPASQAAAAAVSASSMPPSSSASSSASVCGDVSREVTLSCGEHTDYGLLTLVLQDPGISALQVKNSSGAWVNAVPLPGTFVCNIGDMLKLWSNGLYEPTPHRVVNLDPTRSRVSVPFFYEPCFEAVVEPAAELIGKMGRAAGGLEGKMKDGSGSGSSSGSVKGGGLRPVRYGSHLESKVLTNFEL